MTILAVCLAAAALLATTVTVTLGIIGYRRVTQELLDLDDRIDQVKSQLGLPPQQRPTPPTSLFDRRPEEI